MEELRSDDLLSVPEFARKCGGERKNGGVSPWTVHGWLSKGRIRRTKVGSRTFIRASELAKVIKDEPESRALS